MTWFPCVLVLTSSTVGLAADETPASTPNASASSASPASALFLAKIGPLLQRKCAGCHGDGDELAGELDLRGRTGLLKGGENGPALVAGQPEKSPLFVAVTWRDENLRMPPKERNRLTQKEVELVRRWISGGAPWPTATPKSASQWDAEEGVAVATSDGQSEGWTNRKYDARDLWAYRPICRPAIPTVDDGRDGNAIDAFIHRRLESNELAPATPADRRTLIRRLAFDVTGLPPTLEQIDEFLGDRLSGAYGRLVDRLLGSPRYGERWARHWLDVTRYADTAGFSNDYERPNAWRYRDYVIRSLNADKPFDRFILEQLAGDELNASDPDSILATGYLRMGPWEHTSMSVAAVTRQQYLDDITHNVGVTFLAQGLRCARCHDHKFDPVPTRDYYRIQAVFAPVQFADRDLHYHPDENIRDFAQSKRRTDRLYEETVAVLAELGRKHRNAVADLLATKGVGRAEDLPADERPKRHFGLTDKDMTLQKVYRKRKSYYERERKRYLPFAFSVYSGSANGFASRQPIQPMPDEIGSEAQSVHILAGGALEAPGEEVAPGTLSVVSGLSKEASAGDEPPASMIGRRLALARWIASRHNPLTARVIVNRVWQHHFGGKGIVATPNNFGKMGAKPTHPELLDWLAQTFIDNGWSLKKLHRLILTSATYRRAGSHADSERVDRLDPNNDLLAYYPPRRLSAEEVRDAMLAASGELVPTMGGPGIFPEINLEVALQPRHIMGSVAPAYQPSPLPEQRHRRTIYAFRYRTLPDPMMQVFDQPSSETSCDRRDTTTVTPQAFALFNGRFAHDRALAFAHRLQVQASDPERRLDIAFRIAFGRSPTNEERDRCRRHLEEMTVYHRGHAPVRVDLPTRVRRHMVEELTGTVVAWHEELDVFRNYQRDLKPWDVGPETRAWADLCLVLLNSNGFLYVR